MFHHRPVLSLNPVLMSNFIPNFAKKSALFPGLANDQVFKKCFHLGISLDFHQECLTNSSLSWEKISNLGFSFILTNGTSFVNGKKRTFLTIEISFHWAFFRKYSLFIFYYKKFSKFLWSIALFFDRKKGVFTIWFLLSSFTQPSPWVRWIYTLTASQKHTTSQKVCVILFFRFTHSTAIVRVLSQSDWNMEMIS